MQDLYDIPGKIYMDDYVERRVEKGIKLRVIRSEMKDVEEAWPASTKEKRELHYAPKDMIFPMTMYLYDNKVGIISTKNENFGMIIESKDFYETQKHNNTRRYARSPTRSYIHINQRGKGIHYRHSCKFN